MRIRWPGLNVWNEGVSSISYCTASPGVSGLGVAVGSLVCEARRQPQATHSERPSGSTSASLACQSVSSPSVAANSSTCGQPWTVTPCSSGGLVQVTTPGWALELGEVERRLPERRLHVETHARSVERVVAVGDLALRAGRVREQAVAGQVEAPLARPGLPVGPRLPAPRARVVQLHARLLLDAVLLALQEAVEEAQVDRAHVDRRRPAPRRPRRRRSGGARRRGSTAPRAATADHARASSRSSARSDGRRPGCPRGRASRSRAATGCRSRRRRPSGGSATARPACRARGTPASSGPRRSSTSPIAADGQASAAAPGGPGV